MDFYLTKQWKHKRKYILMRDKYQCQECKKYGVLTEAKLVHHIVPLEEDASLAFVDSNLVSLCCKCHNKKHSEKGGNRRYPPLK